MGSNVEGNISLLPPPPAGKPLLIRGAPTSYKRAFPFSNGALSITACPCELLDEEQLLQANADMYRGLKLLRGMWEETLGVSAGTHFPLAASAEAGGALWGSAMHCLLAQEQRQWRCGYGDDVVPGTSTCVSACVSARREVLQLPSAATPGSSSGGSSQGSGEALDFGFLRVLKGGTFADELEPQSLFIPCGDVLRPGDPVCVLGFPAPLTAYWAQTYLRRPADPAQLSALEALQRIVDLQQNVAHIPHRLFASPGKVCAPPGESGSSGSTSSGSSSSSSSSAIVAHTCSTFPGMSGGPGVALEQPWKLLFVHSRADPDTHRAFNYGVSVNSPAFVRAYERLVLPELLQTPRGLLPAEKLDCLHAYLQRHASELADPSVVAKVGQMLAG